jgi:hypothetical protein
MYIFSKTLMEEPNRAVDRRLRLLPKNVSSRTDNFPPTSHRERMLRELPNATKFSVDKHEPNLT